MNYYYAQIDIHDNVIAVSSLSGEVSAQNMVRLTDSEFQSVQAGMKYNKTTKLFYWE